MYGQLLPITGPTNFQAYVTNTDPMGLISINQSAVLAASTDSSVWVSDPLPITWWPAVGVDGPIDIKLLVNKQWQIVPGTIDYNTAGVLTITSTVAPEVGQYVGWDPVQLTY